MNKELIKKYKKEFDHWLNGGSTLLGIRNLVSSTIRWYPSISDPFEEESTSGELLVIINDEYIEFRKALAEGKIIQINNSKPETWIDIDADKLANYNPSFLRIKPDEPKFKVGDFVTPLNRDINCSVWKIDKVLSCDTLASDLILLDTKTIQPWTPVKNEWCWFYDNPNKDKYCNLSQFGGESNGRCFKTNCGTPWNFCEPFLNSLPSYLKDK